MWLVGPGEPLLRDGWPPLPKQGLEWLYRMPTMHPSLDWTREGRLPKGSRIWFPVYWGDQWVEGQLRRCADHQFSVL